VGPASFRIAIPNPAPAPETCEYPPGPPLDYCCEDFFQDGSRPQNLGLGPCLGLELELKKRVIPKVYPKQ
jgi:hypothetical protein